MRHYVFPWNQGSQSARLLARALGGRVIRRENSSFIPRHTRKVVNWGASDCPYTSLNSAPFVSICSNKLSFYQYVIGPGSPGIEPPRLPRWTTDWSTAWTWGLPTVARRVLNGHSGAGIVYKDVEHLNQLPDAPLYVEYIPKDAEYRVHVFNGEVIDVQRKIRDPNREPTDWKIRSHSNGFVYVRRTPDGRAYKDTVPEDVTIQAKRALGCSGLVFGAVDVVMNNHRDAAFVLEVNSAPGLAGTTVGIYADAIRRYYA